MENIPKLNYYQQKGASEIKRKKLGFLMPFKKSLSILFLFLSVFASSIQNLFSQAPTSENEQRIKAYLEKFPKSDADDNGILTLQELLTHMRKTRKGREKSNNDDPFKPVSYTHLTLPTKA